MKGEFVLFEEATTADPSPPCLPRFADKLYELLSLLISHHRRSNPSPGKRKPHPSLRSPALPSHDHCGLFPVRRGGWQRAPECFVRRTHYYTPPGSTDGCSNNVCPGQLCRLAGVSVCLSRQCPMGSRTLFTAHTSERTSGRRDEVGYHARQ